jgi:oxaloacetate decarboxylase (Na+ extruding) subunit gamma
MSALLYQGAELMLIGMGIVFLFLGLLVVVTSTMSQTILKYFPESNQEKDKPKGQDYQEIVAVISSAIHQYRSNKNK